MRGPLLAATLALAAACRGASTDTGVAARPPPPLPARGVFPPDNPWNTDISADAVDPNSDSLIAACGATSNLHPDFGTT